MISCPFLLASRELTIFVSPPTPRSRFRGNLPAKTALAVGENHKVLLMIMTDTAAFAATASVVWPVVWASGPFGPQNVSTFPNIRRRKIQHDSKIVFDFSPIKNRFDYCLSILLGTHHAEQVPFVEGEVENATAHFVFV